MQALAQSGLVDRRYRVVRWIGQGACASVYEAIDTEDDRQVAIKVMNAELVASPTIRKRFLQEAEAAVHIDSPFIVGVHAVGTLPDDRPYIVMELLDGEDLGRQLDRVGALEEQRAVELAIHALSGLAHAHKRGVLHRDIKPANLVLVTSDSGEEVLKIVDLGISKLMPSSLLRGQGPDGQQLDSELGATKTNAVLGSPVYMSPEQCRGAKGMDHRSDVYSVGVVLFECLTGHVPHTGENVNEIMFKIALEDAPDPRSMKPQIDTELAGIVRKALTRDVDKRFQSASEFREALLEWGAERGARVLPTPSSRRMLTPATPLSTPVSPPISSSSTAVAGKDPSSSRRLQVALADDDDDDSSPRSSTHARGNDETQHEMVAVVPPAAAAVAAAPPSSARSLAESLEEDHRRDRARRAKMLQRSVLAIATLVIVIGGGVLIKRRFPTHVSPSTTAAMAVTPVTPVASVPAASIAPPPSAAAMPEPTSPLAGGAKKRSVAGKPTRKPSTFAKKAATKPGEEDPTATEDTETVDDDPE